MHLIVVLAVSLMMLAHHVRADLDSEAELPALDIKARYCNAGSVGCECMTAENAGTRSRCGFLLECAEDARDGKERCRMKK
jgi:hypothetical protein